MSLNFFPFMVLIVCDPYRRPFTYILKDNIAGYSSRLPKFSVFAYFPKSQVYLQCVIASVLFSEHDESVKQDNFIFKGREDFD